MSTATRRSHLTITSQQARYHLFISQLKVSALFLLQILQRLILNPELGDSLKPLRKKPTIAKEVSAMCLLIRDDNDTYNVFYNHITKEYPFIANIIECAVQSQLGLAHLT